MNDDFMKGDIKSYLYPELQNMLAEMGEQTFRAGQIFKWLHSGIKAFTEMTDISKPLREKLEEHFYITVPEVVQKQVSQKDETIKYLWRLSDGNTVESVLMSYHHGNSVCISSQVGCRMGCKFCASTIGGLVRNLTASEMVDQVLFSQLDSGKRISNIVLMGIGEPLDNYDNVMRFLKLISDSKGMNIGQRHISISTCGLIEKVDKMGQDKLQFTLSVSLHAPDDETRSSIMPVNKAYGVDNLLKTCQSYFKKTGRRISYEYAMINGINDTPRHATLLAEKLKNTQSHVNLILLNKVTESEFAPSTRESMRLFEKILQDNAINVTVRRTLGGDIDASCGQLRRKTVDITKMPGEKIKMDYYGISDKGVVRQINQDVGLIFYDSLSNTALLVVCDGMGGAKAGNIASEIAAEAFMECMKSHMREGNTIIDIMQFMTEAVRVANNQVYDRSMSDSDCAGMGTTLVAAAVASNGTVIANVGDSRAYHLTANIITQITKDHSVVEDMIDRGDLTRTEANTHPNRHLITRVIGTALDTEPDFFFLNVLSGEYLLLCSDGLSNIIPEPVLFTEISGGTNAKEICERLIKLALTKGAPDNVTAVLYTK